VTYVDGERAVPLPVTITVVSGALTLVGGSRPAVRQSLA
jgi:hypothetical protein